MVAGHFKRGSPEDHDLQMDGYPRLHHICVFHRSFNPDNRGIHHHLYYRQEEFPGAEKDVFEKGNHGIGLFFI